MAKPGEMPNREPNNNGEHRVRRRWVTALVAISSFLLTFVVNVASGSVPELLQKNLVLVLGSLTLIVGVISVIVDRVSQRASDHAERVAAQSRQDFRDAAAQVFTSVERTLPTPEASLEQEISEVSASLSATVARLRQVSGKAEAFEAEVKELVARAEAAKATASLHEDDARKIAVLLGSETEERLRTEIEKLTAEHNRQIDQLRRSGNRMALWTFVGGVVLGTVGNIVVALLIR